MKIEKAATTNYPISGTDLIAGFVYEEEASEELVIATDEGTIVYLGCGTQCDRGTGTFREADVKVVIA